MIIKEQEDIDLIQNILSGNQAAQKTLYEKYKKIVKDYIKYKYSVYYEIDDDVSEIMIKVIMTLDTFDISKGKFKTWVMTITKNHMIDRWRDKTIKLTSFDSACISTTQMDNWSENVSNITANSGSVSSSGAATFTCSTSGCFDNNSSVTFLSSQISAADFTLLDMKYVQGYSYCEIGKEFNLTSATVSNKVNYIKTKLKKNYAEMIED